MRQTTAPYPRPPGRAGPGSAGAASCHKGTMERGDCSSPVGPGVTRAACSGS